METRRVPWRRGRAAENAAVGPTLLRRREAIVGFIFVLPLLFFFVAFQFGPTLAAFALSFMSYQVGENPVFDGLGNYLNMVRDPVFWNSVRVTAIYTLIAVPLTAFVALTMASLLTSGVRWVGGYRAVFFLPYVTSTVMAAIVWLYIFDPTSEGLLNIALHAIHFGPIAWLQQPVLVLPALALMACWKGFGYSMMIFVAGLLSIPAAYHEAARVDGASWFARFRTITLPLLKPILFFVLVIETIGSFQVFDAVFVMTSGGPARASYTLVFLIYNQGFQYFNFGYACAVGVFLFVAVFVLSMIQRRVLGGGL